MQGYVSPRVLLHRKLLADIKAMTGCPCGERDPAALDFHHRDRASKVYNVSQIHSLSREILNAEIAKCDVICSNCHRKSHRDENL